MSAGEAPTLELHAGPLEWDRSWAGSGLRLDSREAPCGDPGAVLAEPGWREWPSNSRCGTTICVSTSGLRLAGLGLPMPPHGFGNGWAFIEFIEFIEHGNSRNSSRPNRSRCSLLSLRSWA